MITGYGRTSTVEQIAGLEGQERDLTAAGAEKLFTERLTSVGPGHSRLSSSRRWSGWTGSIIAGCCSPSATSRRPKLRNATVSLMDALRGSIAEDAKAAAPKKTATPQPQKGKKRIAGQVELLLPIAGRKEPPQAETKPAAQPASRRKSG